jgi:hypothetical protein
MNKFLATLLALFLPASAEGQAPSQSAAWQGDPVESKVGVHVVPNFGDDPTEFTPLISKETVRAALKSVDWINGFHQVVVVTSPGISMEVGGSLDPEHGLSAVYRNRPEGVELVTREAPDTISQLEAILLAFLEPGESWRQVQEFD